MVHAPPEVGPRMDFLSGNRVPNDLSKVVKVWSIHYDYEYKLPFIDTLRVEVRSRGSNHTETKCLTYANVVKMEGGREAITQFKPEFNRFQ
jgi:hypothetical protein